MSILLLFSFLAGFVSIMAPCIWPILPIVLSASTVQGRQRPLGITLGLMTSFTAFTLVIAYLESLFPVDPNLFRLIAAVVIGILGLTMLIPPLGMRLEDFMNRAMRRFRGPGRPRGSGFAGGYAMGFSTGLIWAPCAGPILATIATLAATQQVTFKVVLVTLAYAFGLGIPLFLFSLAGSRGFDFMRRFTKYTGLIRRAFGLVLIVAAILVYTNYDKVIQLRVLKAFPSYGSFLTKIEDSEQVRRQLELLETQKRRLRPQMKERIMAPEFKGITGWLNTPEPLTMEGLRGKVVLVDFWTYTCINCLRSMPYVTSWYEKYKDSNFVIVGVHTPEFSFEKGADNVRNAVRMFNIRYPVAQDNDYQTWRAYGNRYWPAKYLIDVNGKIRYRHFGEGRYEETEQAIRDLLEEAGYRPEGVGASGKARRPSYYTTPETYLGWGRINPLACRQVVRAGAQEFSMPGNLPEDSFAFDGAWDISEEAARASKGAALELHFRAEQVFLVVTPPEEGGSIKVFLDGRPVDGLSAGKDVENARVELDVERLYHLIDLKGKPGSHILRLEFENDGISAYAFTFG
ncbi:MAG: cytochrome c biogenesis protein DipZ [Candidatus Omnitrophota bacterium]